MAGLTLSGDVFELPAGPIQAAVGYEYNELYGKFDADFNVQATDEFNKVCKLSNETCTGDSQGDYDVNSVYAEFFIPVLKDMLGRRGLPVRFEYVNLPKNIAFAEAEAVAAPAIQEFLDGKVDSVHLIYNEFKSVMQQRVVVEQLLPLAPVVSDEKLARETAEYIYEPSAGDILDGLLMRYVDSQVYRGAVENVASEMAARMVAMKAATDNAGKLISELQLAYNKARQAAITTELAEIVGGAAAV
jgi:ATP synthase F1 gamma subunit